MERYIFSVWMEEGEILVVSLGMGWEGLGWEGCQWDEPQGCLDSQCPLDHLPGHHGRHSFGKPSPVTSWGLPHGQLCPAGLGILVIFNPEFQSKRKLLSIIWGEMEVFSWSPLALEAAFENCCYFHHAVKKSILTWCARVGGWPAPSVLPVGTSSLPASQAPSWARDHSTTCRLPEDNSGISLGCPG